MKINPLLFLFILVTFTACSTKTSDSNWMSINERDSLNKIVINTIFLGDKADSKALEEAIHICDKILAANSPMPADYKGAKEKYKKHAKAVHLINKIVLLNLSGRHTEAFLAKGELLSKDDTDIDRMIYNGEKYSLMNMKDSSDYYFTKAINRYEKLTDKKFDLDLLVKRMEIYYWLDQDSAASEYINSLRIKYPNESESLDGFNDSWDYVMVQSRKFRDGIKL